VVRRPTQPSIPPRLATEDQLRLDMERHLWLMRGLQVKLCDSSTMRAITGCFCDEVASQRSVVSKSLLPVRLPVQVIAGDMIKRQCLGVIVNVSSIMSQCARERSLAYNASKGALDQLTRSMVVELGPSQVTLSSVVYYPGFVLWLRYACNFNLG